MVRKTKTQTEATTQAETEGVLDDNSGVETDTVVGVDLPDSAVFGGVGDGEPNQSDDGRSDDVDRTDGSLSAPPNVLEIVDRLTKDERPVYWRQVSISDGHRYFINTDGEVFGIDIVTGYLTKQPIFTRRMNGAWNLEPWGGRRAPRWTPRMERDLELAYVQLIQHYQRELS